MLFNKRIDTFIVGENYLSYILLLKKMMAGEKVLLVDDERINLGDIYLTCIGQLEKELLKLLGNFYNIAPLKEIDSIVFDRPITVVIGNKRVRIGSTPVNNLREIARKFPHWLINQQTEGDYQSIMSQEDSSDHWFNKMFFDYAKHLSRSVFESTAKNRTELKNFYEDCPPQIKNFYDNFKRVVNDEIANGRMEIASIISMFGGFFHNRISLNVTDHELFHIFLSILLPHYQIDNQKFKNELQQLFLSSGGQFKKTNVKEWIFHSKGPWAIELESYDGVIRPQKIMIVGGFPGNVLFDVAQKMEIYRCFEIEICCKHNNMFTSLKGERFLFSGKQMIGATIPYWDIEFQDTYIFGKIYFKNQDCIKEDFIKDFIFKEIFQELSNLIVFSTQDIQEYKFSFGPEIILDAIFDNNSFELNKMINRSILDVGNNARSGPLKNIQYIGPYNNVALGLFSDLLNIKDL